jgi:hypothetical protein
MEVENKEMRAEDLEQEALDILKEVNRISKMFEELINLNQLDPYAVVNVLINMFPAVSKAAGLPYDGFKALLEGTLKSYEKRWEEM